MDNALNIFPMSVNGIKSSSPPKRFLPAAIAETSFHLYQGEYVELIKLGKTVLKNRYLKRRTGALPGKKIALAHRDVYYVGKILKVRECFGQADIEVELTVAQENPNDGE